MDLIGPSPEMFNFMYAYLNMFMTYLHLLLASFAVNIPEYSVNIGEEYELDTGSSANATLHTLILQNSIINP